MADVGYYAPLRQIAPGDLLSLVQRAERAGFACALCADHFHPRSAGQHQAGNAWTWLGSAMATTPMPFGVVTCPFGRQHPAVVAQAAATLADMHVDRFWMAVGSGEAVDERITGAAWPNDARQRQARLQASVEMMRALWRGEEVTRNDLVPVDRAQLYSRPAQVPHVFAAVCDVETARWSAGWADGLLATSGAGDTLGDVIRAFLEGGGAGKPVALHVRLSCARSDAESPSSTHGAAGDGVRAQVRTSPDLQRHLAWLQEDLARGVDQVYLHNVDRDEERFIDDFGAHILPALGSAAH
jgi:G6PDH family F420-dependent oxidoreductase